MSPVEEHSPGRRTRADRVVGTLLVTLVVLVGGVLHRAAELRPTFDDVPARAGVPVTLPHGTTFTATDVQLAQTVTDPNSGDLTTDGVWLLVRLESSQDTRPGPFHVAWLRVGERRYVLGNPGLQHVLSASSWTSTSGWTAFEIPRGDFGGARLELSSINRMEGYRSRAVIDLDITRERSQQLLGAPQQHVVLEETPPRGLP